MCSAALLSFAGRSSLEGRGQGEGKVGPSESAGLWWLHYTQRNTLERRLRLKSISFLHLLGRVKTNNCDGHVLDAVLWQS